jgi:hypothetical protein
MDDSLRFTPDTQGTGTPSGRPEIAVPSSPLPCDADSFADWRWRTAINLTWISTGPEPCPDDPWLKEAVEFWAITKRGWGDQEPTSLQRAILAAHNMNQSGALERDLVEARLLVAESPEEIAQSTGIDVDVVSAYANLFFDVSSIERRFAWSTAEMLGRGANIRRPTLGGVLKNVAYYGGKAALEAAIDVVLRLDGPSFIDGLSVADSLTSTSDFMPRVDLAMALLPLTKTGLKLRDEVTEAVFESIAAGKPSPRSKALTMKLLTIVRIPASTRRQISRLRKRQGILVETRAASTESTDIAACPS